MLIVVIGAGPAGCAVALALRQKLRRDARIVVFEHDAPSAVDRGFGVVLPPLVLARLAAGGARWAAELRQHGHDWRELAVVREGEEIICDGHPLNSVSRSRLVALMRRDLADVGVEVRHQHAPAFGQLEHANLVVVADGASSTWRELVDPRPDVDASDRSYLWLSTRARFERLTFLMRRAATGGVFTAHAYPYEAGRSAFIVEASTQAWNAALIESRVEGDPAAKLKEFCQTLFAEELQRNSVAADRFVLRSFRTVRLGSWTRPRLVVVGDAAHTAHFSIGSGTALALADGTELADCLAEEPDWQAALQRYELGRRPSVEAVQALSQASARWWSTLDHRWQHLTAAQLTWSLLTRTGQYSLSALNKFSPLLAETLRQQNERAATLAFGAGVPTLDVSSTFREVETARAHPSSRQTTPDPDRPLVLFSHERLDPGQRRSVIDFLQTHRESAWHLRGAPTLLALPAAELAWAEAQRWALRVQGVVDIAAPPASALAR